MDPKVLVENRIEDGQKLLIELARAGFTVAVAVWVRISEEGRWTLYIGLDSATHDNTGDAFRTAINCLNKIQDPWVTISDVKFIHTSNPIVKDAITARDRRPGRFLVKYQGTYLGKMAVEEAYIYPPYTGAITQTELLQTLMTLADRPPNSVLPESVITLRDGMSVRGIINGFNVQMPGELTIYVHDQSTNSRRQIAGADVVEIQ